MASSSLSSSGVLQTNNTCDIYRNGKSPPAAPDVAGVPIFLKSDYQGGSEAREGETVPQLRWTHIALMPLTTDVRDGYTYGAFTAGGNDTVWVPDQNGTPFQVSFVESAGGAKRVYLNRGAAPWPTNNL
jgi:hypothetical protein